MVYSVTFGMNKLFYSILDDAAVDFSFAEDSEDETVDASDVCPRMISLLL